jgi:hypothetical protein
MLRYEQICLIVVILVSSIYVPGMSPASAEDLVLPGFTPLETSGTTIRLGGGRVYAWDKSYLPISMSAADRPLVGSVEIVVAMNGQEVTVTPTSVNIITKSAEAVTVQASGMREQVRIEVTTRVEYDGVAMSRLVLTSKQATYIPYIEFRAPITKAATTRLMHWDIPTYRKHIRKLVVSNPQYQGSFQHIVALVDGARSFWWFTDDANQWISNGQNVSRVAPGNDRVFLTQRLIIGNVMPSLPVEIGFNMLATPIKDSTPWRSPSWRIARRITPEEGRGAGLHLWWPEGFPHQALPYSEWPAGVTQEIPPEDRRLHPGAVGVRTALEQARRAGLTRLPYFSAHAPSLYDPVVLAHRKEWEVVPPFVIKPGSDAPFVSTIERPWLSLRAPGLIEHLVGRFDHVIDELGIEGLYFDQGAPMTSENPTHGAWRESAKQVHATLDVLAMRRYFKSLAEMFYRKGKAGHLAVHMSSVPIIPAYTFVTALVQGEEFLLDLKNTDYMGSVPLDVIRTQYTPGQYGIGSIWLDQLWSPRLLGNPAAKYGNQERWLNSPEHRAAWRNYMALILLHDVVPWSFAPVQERQEVSRVLDEFDTARATFVGYWEHPLSVNEQDGIEVSMYRRIDVMKVLLVAVNTRGRAEAFVLTQACRVFQGNCPSALRFRVHGSGEWAPLSGERMEVPIPARDFRLIELAPVQSVEGEGGSLIRNPRLGRSS